MHCLLVNAVLGCRRYGRAMCSKLYLHHAQPSWLECHKRYLEEERDRERLREDASRDRATWNHDVALISVLLLALSQLPDYAATPRIALCACLLLIFHWHSLLIVSSCHCHHGRVGRLGSDPASVFFSAKHISEKVNNGTFERGAVRRC